MPSGLRLPTVAQREEPSKSPGTMVLRADAGPDIGAGHLFRCLALGQAWLDAGGHVIVVTATREGAHLARLRREGFETRRTAAVFPDPSDVRGLTRVLSARPGAWVVVDGYSFDGEYHEKILEAGGRLAVIDDTAHLPRYDVHVVVNQNLHATERRYVRGSRTRLLLGPRYALLRREFRTFRRPERQAPRVARLLLITMGGSDPQDETRTAIRAVAEARVAGLETVALLGPGNARRHSLSREAARLRVPVRFLAAETDVPRHMAWAHVAIAASGSTSWELAYMGVPFIAVAVAENQRPIGESLERAGVARYAGWHEDVTVVDMAKELRTLLRNANVRQEMSERGRRLVDGLGAARVVDILKGWPKHPVAD